MSPNQSLHFSNFTTHQFTDNKTVIIIHYPYLKDLTKISVERRGLEGFKVQLVLIFRQNPRNINKLKPGKRKNIYIYKSSLSLSAADYKQHLDYAIISSLSSCHNVLCVASSLYV